MKKKDNYNISQEPACEDAPCICGSYDHKKHPTCDPSKIKVKPTHTPTPWIAYEEKKNRYHISNDKGLIALVFSEHGKGEANAEMIIRAVNVHEELLRNLKNAYTALCVLSSEKETKLMDEIDNAIARAEGRSCS
jgi:hypothetical protein